MFGARRRPRFPTPWEVTISGEVKPSYVHVPDGTWVNELAKIDLKPNQAPMPVYLRLDMRPKGFLTKRGLRPVLKTKQVPGFGDSLTVAAELGAFCPAPGSTVAVSPSTPAAFKAFQAIRSKRGILGTVGTGAGAIVMGLGAIPALGTGFVVGGAVLSACALVTVAVEMFGSEK